MSMSGGPRPRTRTNRAQWPADVSARRPSTTQSTSSSPVIAANAAHQPPGRDFKHLRSAPGLNGQVAGESGG
jgi:hypothetical protein